MSERASKDYWNYRGVKSYQYKGETFYTVTPIPLYYRRRALLLELIKPLVLDNTVKNICDFGCGDGWYLQYLGRICPSKRYYGIDISESMLERAKQVAPFAELQISQSGLNFENIFDLIFAIAVFAHIKDYLIPDLFKNIYDHLKPGAKFILFEQTGPERREGETWCRRTTQEYVGFAKGAGFEIEQRRLIAFPVHRFFERRIAPYLIRFFSNGFDKHERRIDANRSYFFKLMSELALYCTIQPLRADDGSIEGNSLYVLEKL